MRVFVLDSHAIYRRGTVSCLAAVADVSEVAEAGSVGEAWKDARLRDADVVVVDPDTTGGLEFVRQVAGVAPNAKVLVVAGRYEQGDVVAAVAAGAVGYLEKDSLDPESLVGAVRAAASGAGVMSPELLGSLLRGISKASSEVLEPRGLTLSRLDNREQQVLRLVADGHPIREVAEKMRYSERTIKNVIHDVVTKLNVRTRSQAVAMAVREGLI